MIQRKQTLFLLIAVIAAVICLCLPLGEFAAGNVMGGKSVLYNLWITRPDGSHDFLYGRCSPYCLSLAPFHCWQSSRIRIGLPKAASVCSTYCFCLMVCCIGGHDVEYEGCRWKFQRIDNVGSSCRIDNTSLHGKESHLGR